MDANAITHEVIGAAIRIRSALGHVRQLRHGITRMVNNFRE
jgi:hypothetical protein